MTEQYGVVREEYDGMWRVHQQAVFSIDDTNTVRFVATVDAGSPEDIDLSGINGIVRELMG